MEIEGKIQAWLAASVSTGVSVIKADQNAPRPALPFVTYKALPVVDSENPYRESPDGNGVMEIRGNREITFSLNVYGTGARVILLDIRNEFEKPTRQWELREDGIVFVRVVNGVQDLTEVIGTKFEERAQMDVLLRIANSFTDDSGCIETVMGEAEINGVTINYEIGG